MTSSHAPEAVGEAARQLIPLLYDDVRRIARQQRARFVPGETLRTTALVNETYLNLVSTPAWKDQQHFLRAAALAMRHIITDLARSKLRQKRDGGVVLPLDEALAVASDDVWPGGGEDRILELDEAVSRLAALNPRLAEIVECRFFAGYSEVETAQALGISERTLRRDWAKARAWLYRELDPENTGDQ
jgi:RNA polymerase sigma factor (TIGR02999 family)